MKKLLALSVIFLFLSVQAGQAQVPSLLGYQGFLADSSGNPVSDASRNISFSIYTVATGGSAIWTETQSLTTSKGVFSAESGVVTTLSLAFDVQYYLGISVNGGAELSPRVKLNTSSYAFSAKNVEDNAITSAKIADATIATADLANDAVTSAIIADGTVTSADLASGTLTASDIGGSQVVKSVNTLTDAITLAAGANVTVTPSGNTITIAASASAANTLDMAYDQGGGGVGRTITADNGAVNIAGAGGLTVNGSVGIATTSLAALLTLNQSAGTDIGGLRLVDGSVTWSLYGDAAGHFHLKGGGTATGEVVVNAGTGNVGIGTVSPGRLLDLFNPGSAGTVFPIRLINNTTANTNTGVGIEFGFGNALLLSKIESIHQGDSTTDLLFHTQTTGGVAELMRITGDGNVGIGTSSPTVKLQVESANNTIWSRGTSGTDVVGFQFGNTDKNWAIRTDGANNDNLSIYDVSNTANRLVIDNSGNVGIGTTTPNDAKLEVESTSSGAATTSLMLINSVAAAGTATRLDFTPNTDTTVPLARIEANRTAVGGATDLLFYTSTNGAPVSEKLRITTGGSVGIGTTSPAVKLDVVGDANGAVRIASNETDATNKVMNLILPEYTIANGSMLVVHGQTTSADNDVRIGGGYSGYDSATKLRFFTSTSLNTDFGTERMHIDQNGNVGIGTVTPSALLHVNGTAGNNTGTWSNLSDRRLKKNIQNLDGSLEKILRLRGVIFQWKDPKRHNNRTGKQIGFVAQEVEKVIPDWVTPMDDGYKWITPRVTRPYLWKR